MIDQRVTNLAKILVNYSIGVKPGDWVIVQGDIAALPLVNEVVGQVLRGGGHPTYLLDNNDLKETVLRESNDEQLQWIAPHEEFVIKRRVIVFDIEPITCDAALAGWN